MIDLHSHLLPAVDDGAASIEDTTAMLRLWSDFGFTTVAATHHFFGGESYHHYAATIERAVDTAGPAIDQSEITVVIGAEIMLDLSLPDRLQRGERLMLGGSRAVLVEVPFLSWPNFTEEVIFELQLAGLRPVLAHPERYDAVQAHPQKAIKLGERGVVLQITHASLTGVNGKAARKTAEQLIGTDLPLILASDAHGVGQRLQAVPDALRAAESLVGEDRLRQLTNDVPKALLDDDDLPEPAERRVAGTNMSKRSWLRRG